jgi:transcriptional regulator with XRE-family HTH domain
VSDGSIEFDAARFYSALEATTRSRGLNWKQAAEGAGVHASTLSRMAQGRRPDATSLALLAAWSGLNPAEFVSGVTRAYEPDPLARLSSFVHADPNLSSEAARALDEVIKATYLRLVTKPPAVGTGSKP